MDVKDYMRYRLSEQSISGHLLTTSILAFSAAFLRMWYGVREYFFQTLSVGLVFACLSVLFWCLGSWYASAGRRQTDGELTLQNVSKPGLSPRLSVLFAVSFEYLWEISLVLGLMLCLLSPVIFWWLG